MNPEGSNNNQLNIPEGTPMKECKYCKMQIPEKAKVCPYCRKRLRGRWIRIVLGSIAALFVLIIVLAVAGGSSSDKDKGEASSVQRTVLKPFVESVPIGPAARKQASAELQKKDQDEAAENPATESQENHDEGNDVSTEGAKP